MTDQALHPYVVFAGAPIDGAALVITTTTRRAKKLGFPLVRGWFDVPWTEIRGRRLREHEDYLLSLGDGKECVIEDPPTCGLCHTWGKPLVDGRCEDGCDFVD